jgi:hypothetical protein
MQVHNDAPVDVPAPVVVAETAVEAPRVSSWRDLALLGVGMLMVLTSGTIALLVTIGWSPAPTPDAAVDEAPASAVEP